MKCEICGSATKNKYCSYCSETRGDIAKLNSLCKTLEELMEKAEDLYYFSKRSDAVDSMNFSKSVFFTESIKLKEELQERSLVK